MTTTTIVLLIITIINLFVMYLCTARNDAVFNYRIKVRSYISEQPDWQEKSDIVDTIGYFIMVLKFWRPLRSFYPEDWDIK